MILLHSTGCAIPFLKGNTKQVAQNMVCLLKYLLRVACFVPFQICQLTFSCEGGRMFVEVRVIAKKNLTLFNFFFFFNSYLKEEEDKLKEYRKKQEKRQKRLYDEISNSDDPGQQDGLSALRGFQDLN